MTSTQTLTEADAIEVGNVLRLTDTDITGSVTAAYSDRIEVNWSDGNQSIERYPIVNVEFV